MHQKGFCGKEDRQIFFEGQQVDWRLLEGIVYSDKRAASDPGWSYSVQLGEGINMHTEMHKCARDNWESGKEVSRCMYSEKHTLPSMQGNNIIVIKVDVR